MTVTEPAATTDEARVFQVLGSNAEEFQRMISEETGKWRRVIEEAKIKIE